MHSTDTTVKPIIGNKDIEKISELVYNKENLKFETISIEALTKNIEENSGKDSDEACIETLMNAITQPGTVTEKLNVLTYFESLIVNSSIANRFINSRFRTEFVDMLQSTNSPNI